MTASAFDPGHFMRRIWILGLVVLASLVLLSACNSKVARLAKQKQPTPPPSYVTDTTLPGQRKAVEPEPEPEPEAQTSPSFAYVPPGAEPGVIKVGLLLPLTGQHAAIGQALLNAAQLALFDLADESFELVVGDTSGTPLGARVAAEDVLGQGVSFVLGPLFASSVTAVRPLVRPFGVPVVAFSNDRLAAGDGVFVMGLAPGAQVERVVAHSVRQGITRFALMAPSTAYGDAVISAMQQAVAQNGAELSRLVTYTPGSEALDEQVKYLAQYDQRRGALAAQRKSLRGRGDAASRRALSRLKNLDTLGNPDFEAVMLPVGGKDLLALAPLFAYYDVDPAEVKYLGTAVWDDPRLGTEPALVGGWFAGPPPGLWTNFQKRYRESYGTPPPRLATLAYDGTALAAVLARQSAGLGRYEVFTVEAITQPSGFGGVDGIFRFLPSGEVQRGLAVLELAHNEIRVVDPAPTSFQQLVN